MEEAINQQVLSVLVEKIDEQVIERNGSWSRCLEMGWWMSVYHCRFSGPVVALGRL